MTPIWEHTSSDASREESTVADQTMSKTGYVIMIVAVLIALLAGAGVAWLVRDGEIGDLEDRLATAEQRLAEIAEAEEAVEPDEPEDAEEPPAENGEDPEEPAEPTDDEAAPSAGPTERVPAIVVGVRTVSSVDYVTLDYIQFLTGDEAAAAATAAGEESPPPNDYFIVNENPRLREFPIKPGISVPVVYNPDGLSDPSGTMLTLSAWLAGVTGATADYYTANFYWVDVANGTVVGLEQQYLP